MMETVISLSNDAIVFLDLLGCLYLLYKMVTHTFEKDAIGTVYKVGTILGALGLLASFIYGFDANFGSASLNVWDIPLWGLKDLGILVIWYGSQRDLNRAGLL